MKLLLCYSGIIVLICIFLLLYLLRLWNKKTIKAQSKKIFDALSQLTSHPPLSDEGIRSFATQAIDFEEKSFYATQHVKGVKMSTLAKIVREMEKKVDLADSLDSPSDKQKARNEAIKQIVNICKNAKKLHVEQNK